MIYVRSHPRRAGILRRNVYGWFARTERGVYRLTAAGEAALRRWPGAVVTPHAHAEPPSVTSTTMEPAAVAG